MTETEIIEKIRNIKKGTPFCNIQEKELRKLLLEKMGELKFKEIGGFILTKGHYKNKPYINIYTLESYQKARDYLSQNVINQHHKP